VARLGDEGTPPRHRQRFVDADPRDAVGALVEIIRGVRPHVVVTYDANGGYGHPDMCGGPLTTRPG
jgi:N-acetyl-1-D-myo-inositol-2-amino-2-deoxy-alpha-D-glucopyranoside deacetylase